MFFRNVLYWSADPNINKVTKAFYLIAALVGDIEDIIDCQENHKGLKDFQNLGCEIVLTRKTHTNILWYDDIFITKKNC